MAPLGGNPRGEGGFAPSCAGSWPKGHWPFPETSLCQRPSYFLASIVSVILCLSLPSSLSESCTATGLSQGSAVCQQVVWVSY